MATPFSINRRDFIKSGLATGTGLMLGIYFGGCSSEQQTALSRNNDFTPSAWLKIGTDNSVTVILSESEMGQGVSTSIPMLVAEELNIDWNTIRFELAPYDPEFGRQITSGSTSIRKGWEKFRKIGAIAKDMLLTAAARKWGVEESECYPDNGSIKHKLSNRKITYGELAKLASQLPIPSIALLKDPKDFKFIGKPMPLLDANDKVTGNTIFGCDVKLDTMLFATIIHCPVFGGQVSNVDSKKAEKTSGVKHIFEIDSGVAIVAENSWSAIKAMNMIKIDWSLGNNHTENTRSLLKSYSDKARQTGSNLASEGDTLSAFKSANKILSASFVTPFQAHATMEPMNCTADVTPDHFEIWAPTQSPTEAWDTAMETVFSKTNRLLDKISNQPNARSKLHSTFLGGGFGRRLKQDYVKEATQISKKVGSPVQLFWTREEDMQHDFYRPATYHQLKAALDNQGLPVAWQHKIVGPAGGKSTGGATRIPYAIPNLDISYVKATTHVPIGSWRSVGSSHNGFVIESFVDEMAIAAGQDPYSYRLNLLANSDRDQNVLKLASTKANWGNPPNNRYQGIAYFHSYGSRVAQVAEISLTPDKKIIVHKVVCAVDCGMVVNPNTVKAQMESAIVFALTATLKSKIDIDRGRVAQSNFHDFPLLRIDEMPKVETHIVQSTEPPGGIGEPGVPPLAAAIANAVFSATGIRVRKLPILPSDLQNH